MTVKEAIEWLNCLKEIHEDDISDALGTWYKDIKNDHNKALDMAIEALKAQDMTLYMNLPEVSAEEVVEILKRNNRNAQLSVESTTKDSTFDCISRQDAIDKMQEVDWYHQNKNGEMVHGANSSEHQAWYKAEDVYKVLEDMPSAQPELIMCKDCKFADREATSFNGMYWCIGRGSYMRYCSDATRRTDADMRGEQDG